MNRQEAIVAGLKRYATGKPCSHGHLCERWAASGDCVQCHSARNSLDHYASKKEDPMITVNEQIRGLQAQVEALKNHFDRPAPLPPKRVPNARCTSQVFNLARLVNGKVGRLFDDGHTKISVVEVARTMAARFGNPIRYIDWQTNLDDVTGPDAVLVVERIHVTDDDGGSGRNPTLNWPFSNSPPSWLKFGGCSEVMA
jgi:hypothetical protein